MSLDEIEGVMGARVTYHFESGREVTIGGSFDLEHASKIKPKIERRYKDKIIGHTIFWRRNERRTA